MNRTAIVESELVFQRVYGITLACDEAVPGIDVDVPRGTQVRVHMREMPEWFDDSLLLHAAQIYPARGVTDAAVAITHLKSCLAYHFEYDDGVRFIVNAVADELWLDWPPSATLDAAAMYLLGPVMTWILRLRGTPSLHASVVVIKDHAVLLIGGEGAGKSTTAAALAKLGVPILSDDLAPIDSTGALSIHAGYSCLRLWPDSADALFESDALSPLAEGWDKLGLDLQQNGFASETRTLPLGALYLFATRASAHDAPRIEAMSPRAALLGLVANSAAGPLLDTRMRADELALMGRIVAEVPVRRLVPGGSLAGVTELCELLLRDANEHIR